MLTVWGGHSSNFHLGNVALGLIRNSAYGVNKPSFLSNPAKDWLIEQNADSTIQVGA